MGISRISSKHRYVINIANCHTELVKFGLDVLSHCKKKGMKCFYLMTQYISSCRLGMSTKTIVR